MARIARVIIPETPHHVIQRGNRKQQTFFLDSDFHLYLELMGTRCKEYDVQIWAYCLMINHVHLIVVPKMAEGLRLAIGDAHQQYTRRINQRQGWKGHLWQGRFYSCPMDERYTLAAARYIELNPVRAGICDQPWKYRWSSAKAHLAQKDDKLVMVKPLNERVDDWQSFLTQDVAQEEAEVIRKHGNTGRPLGSEEFIEQLEQRTNRKLKLEKRGRKPCNWGHPT